MAARKPLPKPKIKYPRAKVGNFQAPIDTTGMSPEEKEVFGFTQPKKRKKS